MKSNQSSRFYTLNPNKTIRPSIGQSSVNTLPRRRFSRGGVGGRVDSSWGGVNPGVKERGGSVASSARERRVTHEFTTKHGTREECCRATKSGENFQPLLHPSVSLHGCFLFARSFAHNFFYNIVLDGSFRSTSHRGNNCVLFWISFRDSLINGGG